MTILDASGPNILDPDDAIFAAYKVAKATGDHDRAAQLLAMLTPTKPAAVVSILKKQVG